MERIKQRKTENKPENKAENKAILSAIHEEGEGETSKNSVLVPHPPATQAYIPIVLNGKEDIAASDTCASSNYIEIDSLPHTVDKSEIRPTSTQATLGDSSTLLKIIGTVSLVLEIRDTVRETASFSVVPKLLEKIIIGSEWMHSHNAVISYPQRCIMLGAGECTTAFWVCAEPALESSPHPAVEEIQTNFLSEYHARYIKAPQNYPRIFDNGASLTQMRTIKYDIVLKQDTPTCCKSYSYLAEKKPIIEDQIQDMLQQHIIQPAVSSFQAPIVFQHKPSRAYQFCVDYRGQLCQNEQGQCRPRWPPARSKLPKSQRWRKY